MRDEYEPPASSAMDPDRFKTLIRDEICAMQYRAKLARLPKSASLTGFRAGVVDVLRYTGNGEQWGARGRDSIRLDRADYYVVCLPESARLLVRQNNRASDLYPGMFAFVSTSRPFEATIQALDDFSPFSALHVRIPGPEMRRRVPNIDETCGRAQELAPGVGRTMQSLFETALRDGPYFSEKYRDQFGRILCDSIAEAARPASERASSLGDRTSGQRRIVEQAQSYIAAHLADADLGPTQVAVHCGVSKRYLHAAFASLSVTVSGLIRESRLQACRAALRSPVMCGWTVTRIAGDWGFDDPARFSHLYKSRFGKTPRQDRLVTDQAASIDSAQD